MSDDKRLERMETKLDDLDDQLAAINVTLAAQHITLKDHIKRTRALEEAITPIQKHVNMVQGAVALISLLGLIAGIIAAFRK